MNNTSIGHWLSRPLALALAGAALAVTGAAQATPITGEELAASSSFDAPSTNALNFAKLVPGREGQDAPYVLFDSATAGTVSLDFFNPAPGVAFFEYRIDGVTTGSDPHPVVAGDVIHQGVFLSSGDLGVSETFTANQMVEVRLALGAERDWDFDWTSFSTAASVPEPGTLMLFGVTLLGLGVIRRKRAA